MFRDKDFPWPPIVLHNFQEQERNKIEEWSISIQEEWPKKKKENKNNEPWQEQKKKGAMKCNKNQINTRRMNQKNTHFNFNF